uniref:Phosphodiesterase n=1 Tax=Tetraselmis sp. GSL018 TaxID=582737 RepID=A0A061S2M8_9CHLO|mmetsp:Transcript_29789/g.71032  ORF Transcript_29789/g.71032 Transcript_29789/m.71032 type:complete len:477 (+) Transcript_29789:137-1567(+)
MGGGQSCPTFCRSSDSVVSSSVFATTSAKDPVPVRGAIEPQSSSPSCRREDSASIVDPCSRLANSKTDSQTAISKTTTAFGVLSDSARETELGQLRFSADISTSCRTYAAPARFNAFNFSEMFANALLKFSVTVLKEPCTKLRICLTKLERFCETVNQRMPDSNPYHNALHVLDVVQLMHVQTMIEGPLHGVCCDDPVVQLSAVLAALVHDLDHPGLTNAFLRETEHPLVDKHGPDATAERMHFSTFRQLLEQPELNFLEGLSSKDLERVFRFTEAMVMATDMSKHLNFLSSPAPADGEARVQYMLQLAMKVADLSHCVRRFDVHTKFVDRLKAEFYSQGDQERSLDMPVSKGMERRECYSEVAASQVDFLKMFVLPMFDKWVDLCGSSPLVEAMRKQLLINIDAWRRLSGGSCGDRRLPCAESPCLSGRRATVAAATSAESRRLRRVRKSVSTLPEAYGRVCGPAAANASEEAAS